MAHRRRLRRLLAGLAFGVLAYGFVFADGGLLSILSRRARIRQLARHVEAQEQRHVWLQEEIARRQKDRPTIERIAREQYGLVYPGTNMMVAIFRALASSAPVPVCLHLDHCTEMDYCKKCADAGYTNIMIDASKQTFEENIRQTKEVVDYCHSVGNISVDGELGTVSGVEDQVKVAEDEAQLANPAQAVEFVERTGVDIFAPASGTAHGVYKTKNPKIDFERMATIHMMLNGNGIRTPLVVHGGTGLPEDYIKKLLAAGGEKFNVSTELKHTLIDSKFEYITRAEVSAAEFARKALDRGYRRIETSGDDAETKPRAAPASPAGGGGVPWEEAHRHAGEEIAVEGTIVRTHRAAKVLYLNFHPNWKRYLSLVIPASDLPRFPQDPEKAYQGKKVRARGEVRLYKDRPEMVIRSPEDITIVP